MKENLKFGALIGLAVCASAWCSGATAQYIPEGYQSMQGMAPVYTLPGYQPIAQGPAIEPPDVRVSPNIRNLTVKEALASLFNGKAAARYTFDGSEATRRVTLTANNLRLATAVAAIADQAGLNWAASVGADSSGKSHIAFNIAKRLASDGYRPDSAVIWRVQPGADQPESNIILPFTNPAWGLNNFYRMDNGVWSDSTKLPSYFYDGGAHPTTGAAATGEPTAPSTSEPAPSPETRNESGVPFFKGLPYIGRLFTVRETEERSTFTCPTCRFQATILAKRHPVKCAACGREMQDDWKVCPFDGARRPAGQTEWRVCPHCGTPIKSGGASGPSTSHTRSGR